MTTLRAWRQGELCQFESMWQGYGVLSREELLCWKAEAEQGFQDVWTLQRGSRSSSRGCFFWIPVCRPRSAKGFGEASPCCMTVHDTACGSTLWRSYGLEHWNAGLQAEDCEKGSPRFGPRFEVSFMRMHAGKYICNACEYMRYLQKSGCAEKLVCAMRAAYASSQEVQEGHPECNVKLSVTCDRMKETGVQFFGSSWDELAELVCECQVFMTCYGEVAVRSTWWHHKYRDECNLSL
ncbi:hypothetical protein L7F22_020883 [Adiantum nelumboides]|nr:hypothetical protein [Adiantum nelumboides]